VRFRFPLGLENGKKEGCIFRPFEIRLNKDKYTLLKIFYISSKKLVCFSNLTIFIFVISNLISTLIFRVL
jgi:hypothetical protein